MITQTLDDLKMSSDEILKRLRNLVQENKELRSRYTRDEALN